MEHEDVNSRRTMEEKELQWRCLTLTSNHRCISDGLLHLPTSSENLLCTLADYKLGDTILVIIQKINTRRFLNPK